MILFYVSGHGFGHATRTRAVIEALRQLRPDLDMHVRTRVPAWIFGDAAPYSFASFEPEIVESDDALNIEHKATSDSLARFLAELPALIEQETRFAQEAGATLIAADMPFVAGFIARRLSIPAVAIGNFTWDWIYEAIEGAADGISLIREGYGAFDLALRYPLSHKDGWEAFPSVQDVSLVTPRSTRPIEEIRAELGLQNETRPVVQIGGRARLSPCTLDRIEAECRDYVFLRNDALPNYHDVIRASDIVVSKLGYSTAAECIAEGKALLYPPREGFREETVLLCEASRLMRIESIPYTDWQNGDWKPWLDQVMSLPCPVVSISAEGARECAEVLSSFR